MPDVPGGADSPQRWRQVRGVIRRHRHELSQAAAGLYPDLPRVGSTGLLCHREWLADQPLAVDGPRLRWVDRPPAPVLDGTGPLSAHVRPRTADGNRLRAYSDAIAALDAPALFEDRACYRLLAARLAGLPELTFCRGWYFRGVDLGHAVAHELAAAWLDAPGGLAMGALPLRAAAGDPCALSRRHALTAVTTLTLRRSPRGETTFVLHWRDPAKVNHAGGMYQVMPAGIFQPVTGTPAAERSDLSLWRCMTREFSEEFLGTTEDYDTRDGVLDYGRWPFYRRLTSARRAGTLRVWCLGLGVDPLTLATDILTVAVFDSEVFDAVFHGLVELNAEGRVVTRNGSAGIPFTAQTVARFSGGSEPVQPAGAALLRLAWQHRRALLG